MKDERTEKQKYQAKLNAVNLVWESGWQYAYGWIFYSPSGSKHDLSAADLTQLRKIEADGLFVV